MTVQVRSTTRRPRAKKVDLSHIVKLGNGKFLVKLPNGRDPQGKLVHKRKGPFATQAEAVEARDALKLEIASSPEPIALGRDAKEWTLRDWAKHYLGAQVANDSAVSTADKYTQSFNRHVLPYLGMYPLSKLTKEVIEAWREDLKKRGVGPSAINYAIKRLKSCLSAAVDSKHVPDNAAAKVKFVDEGESDVRDSNFADYPKLFAAVEGHYLAAVIQIGVDTGIRESEFCALRWQDVELDYVDRRTGRPAPRLALRYHMVATGTAKAGTRQLALRPGTKASKGKPEYVPLSKTAVAAFQAHAKALAEYKLGSAAWGKQAGKATPWFFAATKQATSGPQYVVPSNPIAPDALVFPRYDGAPLACNGLYDWFTRICEKAGVDDMKFHQLRHDCGSFMLAANVPLAVVSRHLRHSSVAFTARVYLHLIEEQERLGVDALDSLWASLEARAEAV